MVLFYVTFIYVQPNIYKQTDAVMACKTEGAYEVSASNSRRRNSSSCNQNSSQSGLAPKVYRMFQKVLQLLIFLHTSSDFFTELVLLSFYKTKYIKFLIVQLVGFIATSVRHFVDITSEAVPAAAACNVFHCSELSETGT